MNKKSIFTDGSRELLLKPFVWTVPTAIISLFIFIFWKYSTIGNLPMDRIANFFTVAGFTLFTALTLFIALNSSGNYRPLPPEMSYKFYRVLYEITGCVLFTGLFSSTISLDFTDFSNDQIAKYVTLFLIIFSSLSIFNSLWLLHQYLILIINLSGQKN